MILYKGDCAEVLRALAENSIDSVVTDPPYGLSAEPDMAEVLKHWLAGDDYAHSGRGFMGKSWDSFVPGPATWREVLRVLKPGGHALVFSGTRTRGLMEIALRLAGFEIRDGLEAIGLWETSAALWLYGCLTDDVEVLTEEGWRLGTSLQQGDQVAAWNAETGAVALEPVQATTRAPWDGDLVRFVNDDTDQLLTPNHRVYYRQRLRKMENGVRRAWYEDSFTVAEASDIPRWGGIKLPVAGCHNGPGIGGEKYAALLGWVWTEGGFDKAPSTGVRIYQSESANPERVAEIAALVTELVPRHRRYDRERTYTYKGASRPYLETCWFFTGDMAQQVRKDLPGKHPTWALLWRMTLAEKRAFWDAAVKGDGCGDDFYQKSEEDLVWAQALLATMGQRGCIAMRKAPRDGGNLTITPRDTTELQGRHLKAASERYTGDVWCIQVASGAFVARRKGLVFITGNSGFPKSLDVGKALDKAGGLLPKQQAEILRTRRGLAGLTREALAQAVGCTVSSVRDWEEGRVRDAGGPPEFIVPSDAYRSKLADILGYSADERRVIGVGGVSRGLYESGHRGISYGENTTEAAKRWNGWGTALKPAIEPIILARKPLSGTVAHNVLTYGTGALNIDGCRVAPTVATYRCSACGYEEKNAASTPDGACPKCGTLTMRGVAVETVTNHARSADAAQSKGIYGASSAQETHQTAGQALGRWPPNLLLVHGSGCRQVGTAKVRGSPATPSGMNRLNAANAAQGYRPGTYQKAAPDAPPTRNDVNGMEEVVRWECVPGCPVAAMDGQSEGTPRFFPQFSYSEAEDDVPFFYHAKAARSEREAGCEDLPARTGAEAVDREEDSAGTKSPRAGAGRTASQVRNHHPTVKPVALMRWCVRLITPPGGTVLEPFAGSGTTLVASHREGFDAVGIELDSDGTYLPIIEARVRHAGAELTVHREPPTSQREPPGAVALVELPYRAPHEEVPMSDTPVVTSIVHNIRKGGTVPLSQYTLITGNNGAGKSSVTLALTLALSGMAFNIQGRRRVKLAERLRRLGPSPLTATATFSDGSTSTFELGATTEPSVSPHPLIDAARLFPLIAVEDALASEDKAARATFLGWIGASLTEADVLAKVDTELHAKFREVASAQSGSWPEKVEAAATYAKKRAAAIKADVQAKEEALKGLPLAPSAERIAYVEQQRKLGQELLTQAVAYEAAAAASLTPEKRADLEAQRTTAQQGVAFYEAEVARCQQWLEANPLPGEEPSTPAPPELAKLGCAVALLADAPEGTCPLCSRTYEYVGALRDYLTQQKAALIAAWETHSKAKFDAANASYAQAVEARNGVIAHNNQAATAAQQWRTHLTQVEAQLAAVPTLPPKPPLTAAAVRDALTPLNVERDQLQRAQGAAAPAETLRASIKGLEADLLLYPKLQTACASAISALLSGLQATFEEAVQKYLPDGLTFGADFSEDSFQVGLRAGGRLLDPSEAQRTAVTVAMAMAVAELGGGVKKKGRAAAKKGACYMLVIPEDRDWDVDTLGQVMRAWGKFPGQVIIEATEKPRGKFPAGWTHVDVGAAPAAPVPVPLDSAPALFTVAAGTPIALPEGLTVLPDGTIGASTVPAVDVPSSDPAYTPTCSCLSEAFRNPKCALGPDPHPVPSSESEGRVRAVLDGLVAGS